jgi:parallel beta-helix repeat protein
MLTLVLISALTLAFNIQPVKANGTIYIRADGSIDPPTAPISTFDNVTYILTGNITSDGDGIVVERSNIIIDGNGYMVQGTGALLSKGIHLSSVINARIKDTNIKGFDSGGVYLESTSYSTITGNNITANNGNGIALSESSYNTVSGNNITANDGSGVGLYGFYVRTKNNTISGNQITNNYYGVYLDYSSSNSISGNKITNNKCGIGLFEFSNNNKIYHNNFIFNDLQATTYKSNNTWDDGYPSGGNYWKYYADFDLKSGSGQDQPGSDGIGDAPYIIDANNTDRFPLSAPISEFDAGTWNGIAYNVDIVSNSTLSDFYFSPDEGPFLKFNVTGDDGTSGFCRVTIPKDLLWVEDGWTVYVGEESVNYTIIPDENYTYLYFTYNHSTKTVEIQGAHVIPEFPSTIIPPLLMLTTLIATILQKKKRKTKTQLP